MIKNAIFGLLIILLVIGMLFVGCDNGSTEEEDVWSYVTSFSQLNGTWKLTSYTTTYSMEDVNVTVKYTNATITINSTNKTISQSGTAIHTYSGGNIADLWPALKNSLSYMNQWEGVTISNINDSNYSFTMNMNNLIMTLDDDDNDDFLTQFQINQNGTKLKKSDEMTGEVVIYIKQ